VKINPFFRYEGRPKTGEERNLVIFKDCKNDKFRLFPDFFQPHSGMTNSYLKKFSTFKRSQKKKEKRKKLQTFS